MDQKQENRGAQSGYLALVEQRSCSLTGLDFKQSQKHRILKIDKPNGRPSYYKFCSVCGQWIRNSQVDLQSHFKKQHSHLNSKPMFLKVGNLPLTPKYSNWEAYISCPGQVVPKLSLGFEVNRGGRPSVIIEEQKPKYDFSQNEKYKNKFQFLRATSLSKSKRRLHIVPKCNRQTTISKQHYQRVLRQMQNELHRARTEKDYFAPTQQLKKRHAKDIQKLNEKHQGEIAYWEGEIKKILVSNHDYQSNQHGFIQEITDLKKEKEVLMKTSQNNYNAGQKCMQDLKESQLKVNKQKEELYKKDDQIAELNSQIRALKMSKPELYELFHQKKQEMEADAQQQIQEAKKEGNIYYKQYKDLGDQFERQKKDYNNVIKVKDDYVFKNGELKEQIKEMQSKIISLENKLSSTVTETKKAVYNIEELFGELEEDKKTKLQMYLEGERIYQKSIKTYLQEKVKLENEIKTLKIQTAAQEEKNADLSMKANQYDLLQRYHDEKVERCVNYQLQIEVLKNQQHGTCCRCPAQECQTAASQNPLKGNQFNQKSSTEGAQLRCFSNPIINASAQQPQNTISSSTPSSIQGTTVGSHLESHYQDAIYRLSPRSSLMNKCA